MTKRLTDRQWQIYNALTDDFEGSGVVANRARIFTASPSETAAKYCIQLVKLGYAEKGGISPMFPKWRRTDRKPPQ